jgi:hypothetical protein
MSVFYTNGDEPLGFITTRKYAKAIPVAGHEGL